MSTTLDISLRKVHKPVLNPGVVFTARLDARWHEAVAAAALGLAAERRGTSVAIVCARRARLERALIDWAKELDGKRTTVAGSLRFQIAGSDIWVFTAAKELEDNPCGKLARLFVLDAERIPADPRNAFGKCDTTVIGELSAPGHWFSALYSEEKTLVTAQDIVASYPDQEGEGLDEEDPYYQRGMLCLDEMPSLDNSTLDEFCAKRLWILSNKPIEFLTERQAVEARKQEGQKQRVIPFDRNALQRWVSQRKEELLEKHGGKPWFLIFKSRRGGITLEAQAESYRIAVTCPQSQVATVTDTWDKSKRIFEMVGLFADRDPKAPRRVGDSKTAIEFENGSHFFIGTAGSKGFARGDALSRFHGSEVAHWLDGNLERMESIWSGISAAADYGAIDLETTPNGQEWAWQQYQDAKIGHGELKPILIRWFDDPMNRLRVGEFDPEEIQETLTEEEKELAERHSLDFSQIAFRRQQKRIHKALFPQEMPEDDESCFIVSGTLFFDPETITKLRSDVLETPSIHLPGGREWIWEEPIPGEEYVLGCDSSEGIPGGDPNGIGVMHRASRRQVAAIHGYFRPRALAEHCRRLSKKYNNAVMGIERENHGHAVLLQLENLNYALPHFRGGPLFFFKKEKHADKRRGSQVAREVEKAGWSTNERTRQLMLDAYRDHLDEEPDTIRDRLLVSELPTFRLQSNRKWEHDSGAHDDAIFKWAIALQMTLHKKRSPGITII